MFTPLNKETSKKRLRSIVKERRIIKHLYYKYLLDIRELDRIFSIKLEYEENREMYNQVKEYALYNYILKEEEIDIKKYDIFNFKKVLFLYIRNLLKKNEILKAKKLLNICKEKGYVSNEYYEIFKQIKIKA